MNRQTTSGLLAASFLAFLLLPSSAWGDELVPMIGKGHDDVIQSAILPLAVEQEVAQGFVLQDIKPTDDVIHFTLVGEDSDDTVRIDVYSPRHPYLPDEALESDAGIPYVATTTGDVDDETAQLLAAMLMGRFDSIADDEESIWNVDAIHSGGAGGTTGSGIFGFTPLGGLSPDLLVKLLSAPNILMAVAALFLLLAVLSGLPVFLRRRKQA